MRTIKAALGMLLFLCLIATVHNLRNANPAEFQADFKVYYTAATLVLHGQRSHIYDGADDGSDPQLKFANPGTVYAEAAAQRGIAAIRLYVYPPLLADLLVPLAVLPKGPAMALWLLLNLGALAWTGYLLGEMLHVRLRSMGGLVLGLGLLLSFAVGLCLFSGQITVFLLLLWTIGLLAYARDRRGLSALALALATAIKLTPLIVVAPMLLWGDWRWLRGYAASLFALLMATFAIHRPVVIADYFEHVVPAMSRGIPTSENMSIVSFVQLLYAAAHGYPSRAFHTVHAPFPHGVLLAAKVLALFATLAVLALLARSGRSLSVDGRVLSLALLATLSACIAPVSWPPAYVFVVLPLTLLWAQALRQRLSGFQLTVLTICSVELGSLFLTEAIGHVLHGSYAVAVQAGLAPAAGVLLASVFLRKHALQQFRLVQTEPSLEYEGWRQAA